MYAFQVKWTRSRNREPVTKANKSSSSHKCSPFSVPIISLQLVRNRNILPCVRVTVIVLFLLQHAMRLDRCANLSLLCKLGR